VLFAMNKLNGMCTAFAYTHPVKHTPIYTTKNRPVVRRKPVFICSFISLKVNCVHAVTISEDF